MTFSGIPASRWIGSGPSCRTATGRPASIKGPQDQRGRLIGRTKGGLNTRLHAVTDAKGRPLPLFLTAGQVSDHANAAALPGSLPAAEGLIPDQGYGTDWFGEALKDNGIRPCIPGRKSRSKTVRHDKRRYRRWCPSAAQAVSPWLPRPENRPILAALTKAVMVLPCVLTLAGAHVH